MDVVGLVFIGLETYIKRSLQGKVKNLTDYIISDEQAPAEDAVARKTKLKLDSTMKLEEFQRGGRRLTGVEDSTSTYSQ